MVRLTPVLFCLVYGCGAATPHPDDDPTDQEVSNVPFVVEEGLSTAVLTITAFPAAEGTQDPGPGLRTVVLHLGTARLEPHADWQDGTPMGADASATEAQIRAYVSILEPFFAESQRYHAPRHANPMTSPPRGSNPGPAPRQPQPHMRVDLLVHDVDWYHHFLFDMDVQTEGRATLDAFRGVTTEGGPSELLQAFASELARLAELAPPEGSPTETENEGAATTPPAENPATDEDTAPSATAVSEKKR